MAVRPINIEKYAALRVKCNWLPGASGPVWRVSLYADQGVAWSGRPVDVCFIQTLVQCWTLNTLHREAVVTHLWTRLGKLNRVRYGSWHGGPPPFGYKLEDRKLVVVEEEAKWVKRIFQELVKGSAATHIKQMLDSNGVSPRRKKGLWTLGSINALLTNTHYSGHYLYTDKKSEQTIEVQCPSIVDQTTWNAAQYKRSREVIR